MKKIEKEMVKVKSWKIAYSKKEKDREIG